MMTTEKLNFNALAWEAPMHGEEKGYLPTDQYYPEIVEWLKSGTKEWVIPGKEVTSTRVTFAGSDWDAIVRYNRTTKMLSWRFEKGRNFTSADM